MTPVQGREDAPRYAAPPMDRTRASLPRHGTPPPAVPPPLRLPPNPAPPSKIGRPEAGEGLQGGRIVLPCQATGAEAAPAHAREDMPL